MNEPQRINRRDAHQMGRWRPAGCQSPLLNDFAEFRHRGLAATKVTAATPTS